MSALNSFQSPSTTSGVEASEPHREVLLASAGKRFIGRMLDRVVLCVLLIVALFAVAIVRRVLGFDEVDTDSSLIPAMSSALVFLAAPLGLEAWLIVTRGKSFGRLRLKMLIVRARDGGPSGSSTVCCFGMGFRGAQGDSAAWRRGQLDRRTCDRSRLDALAAR